MNKKMPLVLMAVVVAFVAGTMFSFTPASTAAGDTITYKGLICACKNSGECNLGVEGVDLYGGTKHSTVVAGRMAGKTPEELKRSTMHGSTNKAFERYLILQDNEVRAIYEDTEAARETILNDRINKKKRNVVPLSPE